MTSKTTEKQLRKFLKERNLQKSFRVFQSIKGKRRRRININFEGEKKELLVFKRKKKLIIADAFTLRTLATTTKFNIKNVEKGFIPSKKTRKFSVVNSRGEVIKGLFRKSAPIKLKVTDTTLLRKTNSFKVTRTRAISQRFGRVLLNITFFKGRIHQTVEAESFSFLVVNKKNDKAQAFKEAYRRCVSQISFSYETFIINHVRFVYEFKNVAGKVRR